MSLSRYHFLDLIVISSFRFSLTTCKDTTLSSNPQTFFQKNAVRAKKDAVPRQFCARQDALASD